MEDSKSPQKNQKVMRMKISSSRNNNVVSLILLAGGALVTAAFLVGRNRRKSSKNISTAKNEKAEGLHFHVPDSSPCMDHPSSNGTEKLGVNDSTSLFSTPCLTQDEKPKLETDDQKGDSVNDVVCHHPKEEEKSPSLERLELSEVKASLLPDTKQVLSEVSEGNGETQLPDLHQAQDAISYSTSLPIDDKSKFLVDEKHIVIRELCELQRSDDLIKTDNHEEGLVQEQENQEIFSPDGPCHQEFLPIQLRNLPLFEPELLNSAREQEDHGIETIELKNADYKDKASMQIMHFEEKYDDAETPSGQIAKKCNQQMQFSDEQNCSKENNQANSSLENSPRRTYSMVVQNLEASANRNNSINDQHLTEVIQVIKETNVMDTAVIKVEDGISEGDENVERIELMKAADDDEDKGNKQIMYCQEQFTDTDTQTDQITKKCNLQMQVIGEEKSSKVSDKANSCFEEAISGNSSSGTDSIFVKNFAPSAMRSASADDQHSAEVIQDTAVTGEKNLKEEQSSIQFVEKQSSEPHCQRNRLEEDREASETQAMDIEVVDKDLEAHSTEAEDEVAEGGNEEEEEEQEDDDDDYNNDIDRDGDISEGAGNSSEQSNSDKIWSADSNQELLMLLKEMKVKEEVEEMKMEGVETCNVEKGDLKSIQNDFNTTRCQKSYDGKDDLAVNDIKRHRTTLMYLADVAAITTGRRMLLGALLVLIWCLSLKAFFFPALVDSSF